MAAPYQFEVHSAAALVQQIATSLAPNGYWHYVTGVIPPFKMPGSIDAKLLAKYTIAISRAARSRRKAAGLANVHYLRHRRFFVLLATHGQHPFFADEASRIRDIRRDPLVYSGYSITYKRGGFLKRTTVGSAAVADSGWHSRVQIARKQHTELKAWLLDAALRSTVESLGREFYNLPFEPYAPVRQQLLNLLRLVNAKRKTAGFDVLPTSVIRYRREILKPFERPNVT